MKVLVINLSLRPKSSQYIFPIGLGYIATAISHTGFDMEILDIDAHRYSPAEVERILRKTKYDIVAFGCIVTGYKIVKEISKCIRDINKNTVIIAGNSVASSIPEILLAKTEVDIAVIGEGDITIVEILKSLENNDSLENIEGIYYKKAGEIFQNPPRKPIANIDEIPIIDRDLFDTEIYIEKSKDQIKEPYPMDHKLIRSTPVNTARGCLFKCTFCYQVFYKNGYRYRSAQSIAEEIKFSKEKYGVNYISLCDDLTIFSKKRAEELADAIIDNNLDVYWTACCRANLFIEDDIDLVKKLKRSGCVILGYSLESANDEILKAMNKNLSVKDFLRQKKILDKAGIATATGIVIGYPQETEDTIKETFDFCYENDMFPSTGYLLPQPGTPMYKYALENGYIKNEENYLYLMGDRQDLRLNMTKIESSRLESLVANHLKRIRDKLNLPLDDSQLIKTGHVRNKKVF